MFLCLESRRLSGSAFDGPACCGLHVWWVRMRIVSRRLSDRMFSVAACCQARCYFSQEQSTTLDCAIGVYCHTSSYIYMRGIEASFASVSLDLVCCLAGTLSSELCWIQLARFLNFSCANFSRPRACGRNVLRSLSARWLQAQLAGRLVACLSTRRACVACTSTSGSTVQSDILEGSCERLSLTRQ